jgi:hypothetical protein
VLSHTFNSSMSCVVGSADAAGRRFDQSALKTVTISHGALPATIMRAHQPRPAASFAARSRRGTSNATRRDPKNPQNAQRNYERYLALARAEAQIGNTVGAENYYQYAEHYFRSMRSDSEWT